MSIPDDRACPHGYLHCEACSELDASMTQWLAEVPATPAADADDWPSHVDLVQQVWRMNLARSIAQARHPGVSIDRRNHHIADLSHYPLTELVAFNAHHVYGKTYPAELRDCIRPLMRAWRDERDEHAHALLDALLDPEAEWAEDADP